MTNSRGPVPKASEDTWRVTPKPATVVLSAVAKRGWASLARQVLQVMLKEPTLETAFVLVWGILSAILSLACIDQCLTLFFESGDVGSECFSLHYSHGSLGRLALLLGSPCAHLSRFSD